MRSAAGAALGVRAGAATSGARGTASAGDGAAGAGAPFGMAVTDGVEGREEPRAVNAAGDVADE